MSIYLSVGNGPQPNASVIFNAECTVKARNVRPLQPLGNYVHLQATWQFQKNRHNTGIKIFESSFRSPAKATATRFIVFATAAQRPVFGFSGGFRPPRICKSIR